MVTCKQTSQAVFRKAFCRVYYRERLSYAEMTAVLGVGRAVLDDLRQAWGLPSRRWLANLGTDHGEGELEIVQGVGPARLDLVSGRARQWRLWDRRRLPGKGLAVAAVRVVGSEVYWEVRLGRRVGQWGAGRNGGVGLAVAVRGCTARFFQAQASAAAVQDNLSAATG